MEIRACTIGDQEQVEVLLRSIPGVWQASWRDDVVARALEFSRGLAFVAVQNEAIIGFGCAHDAGFRAYLSELAVAQEWQGQGIGSALLAALTSALSAKRCWTLAADVYPPAAGFFRSRGWSQPDALLLRRAIVDGA